LAKKESKPLDKIKSIVYILIAIITIGGTAFGVEKYFAKASDVTAATAKLENSDKLINQRLEISIIDDQIHREQMQIQRIEDWGKIEQRTVVPKLTIIEKEVLDKAKIRLEKLEKRKVDKINQYEEGSD
jgi:hypothetical protein